MTDISGVGRILIVVGSVTLVAGLLIAFAGRIPGANSIGRLPGDIVWRRGSTSVYVPIVTSILVSLVLSLVLTLVIRR